MSLSDDLYETLVVEEGSKRCVYQDHLGWWTIGVGILVDERVPGAGLRPEEIEWIAKNRIRAVQEELDRALPWARALSEPRYGALILMAYQMGVPGLLKFRTSLRLIRAEHWTAAGVALQMSLWARQTPKRAKRVIRQIETGVWQ